MRQFSLHCRKMYAFSADARVSKEQWAQKEKEWAQLTIQRNNDQNTYLLQQLNEHQVKRIHLLADACTSLSMYEFQCFFTKLNEHQNKSMGVGIVDLNSQWPSAKSADFQSWPPQSKEEIEKAVNALWEGKTMEDFKQLFGGMGGGSISSGTSPQQKEEVKFVEPEKPIEKHNYDIELTAFDPAKKIMVIKEVRQLFNLGLKDAKDLVEKAPCTLSKQVKTVDAQGLKEKLEALGCTIKLL